MRCGGRRIRAAVCAGVWLACAGVALPAAAQESQATLSLEEALALARRNNPDYQAARNDVGVADWAVREAYGALLPGATASTNFQWQGAGTPRFGIFTGEDFGLGSTTSYYSSSYTLGLNYRLAGANLFAPARERAGRAATQAAVEALGYALDADVTRQYLAVLRAQDGVTLAEQELARTRENLRLADARVAVGAAISLETKQAQVEVGRTEVALLQARNLVQTETLRLIQLLGVTVDRPVRLTTTFAVTDVPWTLESLLSTALGANPDVRAARATESASESSVRMARTAYLPSLNVQAGFSGFARQAGNADFLIEQARDQLASQAQSCALLNQISAGLSEPLPGTPADCSAFTLTPDQAARIRSENDVFPFGFTREPFAMSLTVSLPIFQGFTRERQVEEARAAAADARHRLRGQELRIGTMVSTAYHDLVTARQSVELEERNRSLADDQLNLGRERYRLGVATFVELQEAETLKARADRAYLNALYAFHEGLAALEAAVGVRLRDMGEGR